LNGLILALTLILTVVAALLAGIGSSYLLAEAFFYSLGRRTERAETPALAIAEASGD
jgi:hypothetical protein